MIRANDLREILHDVSPELKVEFETAPKSDGPGVTLTVSKGKEVLVNVTYTSNQATYATLVHEAVVNTLKQLLRKNVLW